VPGDQVSVILGILPLGLSVIFGSAAVAKLNDRSGFRTVLLGFGLPRRLAAWTAQALPPVEVAVAAALLIAPVTRVAAIAGAALLALFTTAVLAALVTGRRPLCGCFGGTRAIGRHTLVRNAALLAAALAISVAGRGVPLPATAEAGAAAALILAVLAVAAYRGLRRRGEELLRRDTLEEASAEADAEKAVPIRAAVGVAALVAAGAAAARPTDDLEALRVLLEGARPQLVRSGRRASRRVKAQTASGARAAGRAASDALSTQRKELLDLRARVLVLQVQDPRAENARRLSAESLALFAASLARVQAAMRSAPKPAAKQLTQARQLLQEALYRGSRAGYLLEA
jgi:hypothetical protein